MQGLQWNSWAQTTHKRDCSLGISWAGQEVSGLHTSKEIIEQLIKGAHHSWEVTPVTSPLFYLEIQGVSYCPNSWESHILRGMSIIQFWFFFVWTKAGSKPEGSYRYTKPHQPYFHHSWVLVLRKATFVEGYGMQNCHFIFQHRCIHPHHAAAL